MPTRSPVPSPAPIRPGRLFSLAAYTATAISGLACIAVFLEGLKRLRHPLAGDFGVFYAAGKLAGQGHPLSVYTTARLERLEAALNGGHALHLFFPYPPYVTLALEPLARLPVTAAFAVWTAINVAAFALAGVVAIRRIDAGRRLLGICILVFCLPLVVSTAQGENAGLVALGFTLALIGLYPTRSDANSRSSANLPILAIGVALLLLKPQFLVVPMLLVVARHRPREIAAAATTVAVSLLAGLLTGGMAGYARFFNLIEAGLKAGTKYHWGPTFNYTFQAQVQAILGRTTASTVCWLAMSLGLLLWLVVRTAAWNDPSWLLLGAAAILATTHAMFHDLVILFPLLVFSLSIDRVRWAAVLCLPAILLDPMVYPATHVHLVVLGLACAVVVADWEQLRASVRTMKRYLTGVTSTALWKSFAPPRWDSASGSETR